MLLSSFQDELSIIETDSVVSPPLNHRLMATVLSGYKTTQLKARILPTGKMLIQVELETTLHIARHLNSLFYRLHHFCNRLPYNMAKFLDQRFRHCGCRHQDDDIGDVSQYDPSLTTSQCDLMADS